MQNPSQAVGMPLAGQIISLVARRAERRGGSAGVVFAFGPDVRPFVAHPLIRPADVFSPPGRRGIALAALLGRHFLFHLRLDHGTWTDALQAIDDDLLARVQTAFDDAQAFTYRTELDRPIADLVLAVDDEDELLVLVGADRTFADENRYSRLSAGPFGRERTGRGSACRPDCRTRRGRRSYRLQHRPDCRRAGACP